MYAVAGGEVGGRWRYATPSEVAEIGRDPQSWFTTGSAVPILRFKVREATTESRFSEQEDRSPREGSCHLGTNSLWTHGGILLHEAKPDHTRFFIVWEVEPRPLSGTGKE